MDGLYIGFDNRSIKTIWPDSAVDSHVGRTNPIPAGREGFDHFFEPIYPLMQGLFWFAQNWESSPLVDLIFQPGGEELLGSCQIDHARFDNCSASLLGPNTFPSLARWLRDDWIDLLGFAPGNVDPRDIADELFDTCNGSRNEYYASIERNIELCFFCVDGFSWEIYCHNRPVIDQVFDHVSRMENVRLARGKLQHRDQERFDPSGGSNPV